MNNELKRPEKNRKENNDLTLIKSGTYIGAEYEFNNKPFTGFLILDYHDNGNIWNEIEYHNGEQIGWEVEYHDNGKIKYESLMYGATSIVFWEYDETGNKVNGGFVAPKSLYNECARIIGISEVTDEQN